MMKMKSTRIWTGAEAVVARKVGRPFVFVSEGYGKVTTISKSKVVVEYYKPSNDNVVLLETDDFNKPGVRDTYMMLLEKGYSVTTNTKAKYKYNVYVGNPKIKNKDTIYILDTRFIASGLKSVIKQKTDTYSKTYSLRSWASKIEANQSIKHNMTTTLKENSVITPDSVIIYDESFFEPNIYDPTSIVVRMGSSFNIAFLESETTYEDSMELNKKILVDTGELKYKILSKVVETTSHITNVLNENSKVKYGDKLMTILDVNLVSDTTLSEQAKLILSEASDASPKANANGIIDRIDVLYNCELDDMDESIKDLAVVSNKRFKEERGTDGRVTSEYSINGVPLAKNQIELKYYISYQSNTKIGDKFNIGHQLKSTVGDIKDDITTEDGEHIDCLFSNKSVLARITSSGYTMGVVNAIMKEITNRAVAAYRK